MADLFRKLAHKTSVMVGSPIAFLIAFGVVLAWAVTGPIFGFSDTWQLVINTSTTIVTFLMVFLIQNTQNRDSRAIHMKLDELIIFTRGADNEMVELENMSDAQMDLLEKRFHKLARVLGHDEITDYTAAGDEDADEGGAPSGQESRPNANSKAAHTASRKS